MIYIYSSDLRVSFKDWDYVQQVFTCSDNAEFLACLDSHHIDILLADLDLPDGRGNQSIKAFSTTAATAITIVISVING